MDFCKCCGNNPEAESLDYLYKRSDCAVCGKEKRSKTVKTTGLAKAVLAIEARRKVKMTAKQSDSGPKCNIGHASRVPVNKAKALMRPVRNCKCCGMPQKQCPGNEVNLAQIMVGHFGKQVTNGGDTAAKSGHKKSQKACALDIDKKMSLKKISTDRQLIAIKVPLHEPKISVTTLVCNSLTPEELEPCQSYVLHPSTGAINKSHNFMKFSEHKSKALPPLNKILSDLTLQHSAGGEQRKPPQEEPINRSDVRFDTEQDPYDNDSMLVFPLKFENGKYKYLFVEDFSGYYSPDSEISSPIETICYNSSKLSHNSSSCPCVLESNLKFNEKYQSPKVIQPSYIHKLKSFKIQYDSVIGVQDDQDQKEEDVNEVSIPKSNEVNKPRKVMGILGGMKTANKNPTQSISKLPVALTRHNQNKTLDEKFGQSTGHINQKKILPKVEDSTKKCIHGLLGGMDTERTSLKNTQTRHFYGSLTMRKPCLPKTCHNKRDQNVLKRSGPDTKIVNIPFQSNGKEIPQPKIDASKKKCNNGILGGTITERTGLKTTQTQNSYGSMKVHGPCVPRTSCKRNVLKNGGKEVKAQDENLVNITVQSDVKKILPKVEAPKKKCNNGTLGGIKIEKTCVKPTQRSNPCGSSKLLGPGMARTHYDLSQKGKQALSLRSKQTGIVVNSKNKSLKYCTLPKGVKRLESQPQTKQLNSPIKENEVFNEALGYLRLRQTTSRINIVPDPEGPKCEPPRRVLAKSDTPQTGDINAVYIKKRGKLDLPVYEPRTTFNKSVSYSYNAPENEANEIINVPHKQEILTNSNADINLIKRKEFQALKAQELLDSLEKKINCSFETQNNNAQNKDACEHKTNIKTTNSLTTIKSKQASVKILRKSLWTKFTTHVSREKVVEKLNANKPDIGQSVSNSKFETPSTKASCSVNLKNLSPRMRLLLGINPQKVSTASNQKCMQQNGSLPTEIVLEKKQSKISESKLENLLEHVDPSQRSSAGNSLSHITNELHNQHELYNAALKLNSTKLDNHADQLELEDTPTVIEQQISIQNPEVLNYYKTSVEKTPIPLILKKKSCLDNFKLNSKKSTKIEAIGKSVPEKHISNNRTKETLFVKKTHLEKEEPKIICLEGNKCKKEMKTVKPRLSKFKIVHSHAPKMYPNIMKKLVKNQQSNNIPPVVKTSINRLAKTTQFHPTHVQNLSDDPMQNDISPSNPIESLLGNLQPFFTELSKEEVEELKLQPKQCLILMVAIEIGFKRTGHLVEVTPSQLELAKMETIVLSGNRNIEEDEPKVMNDKLMDDLYIKRRGMIWADPVKEEQPVGCKMKQNVIEKNLEKISEHSTALARAIQEEEDEVELFKTALKVKPKNLKVRFVDQTSFDKDNMCEIPERSIPKVIETIKRNSMIWADPVKEEQPVGCKMPQNNIEINYKNDVKNNSELANSSKAEEKKVKLYKMSPQIKPENLKTRFVNETSKNKGNLSKIPRSIPKVGNIDRDFQANNKSGLPFGSSIKPEKFKSLPDQKRKERKTIPLESLLKQVPGWKNSKSDSDTSTDSFYTCREGYFTSSRHCVCDFPNHEGNNKLKNSSRKSATALNVSKKRDFPKLAENKKLQKSSEKNSTGFKVCKKPSKPCFKKESIKEKSFKQILHYNSRQLKTPKNPESKAVKNLKFGSSTQKNKEPMLKPSPNASLQYNSTQESNEMALVKYEHGDDQLSITSLTDYVDEAKKSCHLEFRDPGLLPSDLKIFQVVAPMIQSTLTNANLILIMKSFIAENFNIIQKMLGNDVEQSSSENHGMALQAKHHQKSDLANFMSPYLHVNCCIHNCRYEVNGSNILGHIAQCHLDWFGAEDSAEQWETIFNDSEAMFSVNPNNYVLGEICFLGLMAYGGDRLNEPPVLLQQCPKNTLLPASMHEIIHYCPIVLYACKLPVVQNPERNCSKQKHINNERLVIWAASFALPFKIELKISVQSKDFSNLRSQTMHVRYFHKTIQNPSEFGHYDNDFLVLYYDELKALTNGFKSEFDLIISIQELK